MNGAECEAEEERLKTAYTDYLYDGGKVLKDGNTELFTVDIREVW